MTDSQKQAPPRPPDAGYLVLRTEDHRLLTGRGAFVSDLAGEGALHAAFVRSSVAHGMILGVDVDEARAAAGVTGVWRAADLDLDDVAAPPHLVPPGYERPLLARDRVRHVGEPIAVVVAETRAQAADAADLVWPDIDMLPVATGLGDGEPPLFPDGNVVTRSITSSAGTARGPFPVSAEISVENQRVAPLAIEGLAVLAAVDGGRLSVTCGHQAPHRLRVQLAAALGIAPQSVRVRVPDVGGAFGLKAMFFTEYVVIAALALRLGRTVLWEERRREHLTAGTHGRGQSHRVILEGDADGRIRRARIAIESDVGAYPHNGVLIPSLSRFVATGLYDIEDVEVETVAFVTNRAPTGSYRGAGRPEAAFALERAIDAFAREAGLDPADVRRRNLIQPTALPYETAMGATYDTGDYPAALERALDLADIEAVRSEQSARLREGRDPVGIGIGAFIERAGGAADSGEFGEVEVDVSGAITVRTGSTAAGQGHQTVWSHTVAGVFDVEPARVTVVAGDTDAVADGVGTYGSRSAQVGASAAFRMAGRVVDRARHLAAAMLEASPDDLRFAAGAFAVAGVPGTEVTLADVAAHAASSGEALRESELFVPGTQTFPYGVHVAVVEVELETGFVHVRRLITVDDCGVVLNPMIVSGQRDGSVTQGLGQALLEGVEYDDLGVPLTSTMVDYLIPGPPDVPDIVSARLVHPAPSNPLGVKGTGEAGCIGIPPAIVNAALDALAPYGVDDLSMPLRPSTVWAALQRAGRAAP